MNKSFFEIYKTFFKIGTLLLGGGYVILPLLQSELAEKKQWITHNELCEYYALSSSLPGVIAINISAFTGNKLAGIKGALAAIFGTITPAFLAIILLASILNEIVHLKTVQNIFWGVGIGIITLLFLAVKEMWNKCIIDKSTTIIYIICLIIALSGKISPAWIIVFSILISIIYTKIKEERNA